MGHKCFMGTANGRWLWSVCRISAFQGAYALLTGFLSPWLMYLLNMQFMKNKSMYMLSCSLIYIHHHLKCVHYHQNHLRASWGFITYCNTIYFCDFRQGNIFLKTDSCQKWSCFQFYQMMGNKTFVIPKLPTMDKRKKLVAIKLNRFMVVTSCVGFWDSVVQRADSLSLGQSQHWALDSHISLEKTFVCVLNIDMFHSSYQVLHRHIVYMIFMARERGSE